MPTIDDMSVRSTLGFDDLVRGFGRDMKLNFAARGDVLE